MNVSRHVLKLLLTELRGSSLAGIAKTTTTLMIFHGLTNHLRLMPLGKHVVLYLNYRELSTDKKVFTFGNYH